MNLKTSESSDESNGESENDDVDRVLEPCNLYIEYYVKQVWTNPSQIFYWFIVFVTLLC